ncbi:hypothetical protein ACU5EH_14885 [Aliivibrio salmonicida]|uniref:hypothetical protein n=1 Tax=Aliivibrio salmonicida TaxID=40269 RepID=UPI00406C4409
MTSKAKQVKETGTEKKKKKKKKKVSVETVAKQDPRIKIEDILAQREFDKMFEL